MVCQVCQATTRPTPAGYRFVCPVPTFEIKNETKMYLKLALLAVIVTCQQLTEEERKQKEVNDFIDYDINQDGYIDASEIRKQRPDIQQEEVS